MYYYNSKEYRFCCRGCADIFVNNPEKYLQEIYDIVVCPTCLAEKPRGLTFKLNYDGKEFHFCGCPHCVEEFSKYPEFFIKRFSTTY